MSDAGLRNSLAPISGVVGTDGLDDFGVSSIPGGCL